MEIRITQFAEVEFKEIFQERLMASPIAAVKFKIGILDEIEWVVKHLNASIKESLVVSLGDKYYYTILFSHKITLYITEEIVVITDMFDYRRNPTEIEPINK